MLNNEIIVTTPFQLSNLIKESITEALSELKIEYTAEYNLMNSDEVCEFLGIAKSTLSNWKREQKIPYKKLGKRICYRKSESEKLLDQ